MSGPASRPAWLTNPRHQCAQAPHARHPHRLVLLGAPGIGKGTQAALISQRLGPCHLSTGDVFRAARGAPPWERSPALNVAIEAMQRGELVSDETVLQIVGERMACLRCGGGFLLDGFPRTIAQAQALEEMLEREGLRLDAVLSYELPLERIVARISGRRVCSACKVVYHVQAQPPRRPGYCDGCGATLEQREDDQPRSVRVRMTAYTRSTAPLTQFYAHRGLLRVIAADGPPEEIFAKTVAMLGTPAHAMATRRE